MKILLLRPSTKGYATPPPDTPSGLMYLASAARAVGHEVTIRDLEFEDLGHDLDRFEFIGVTILSKARRNAFAVINAVNARNPDARIIVGGPHASSKPELLLNDLPISVVVVGEGEASFLSAIQTRLPGFVHSDPLDIDSIAFPAYDLVDLDRYYMQVARNNPDWVINGMRLGDLRYAPMIASRGCFGRCTFCNAYKHWGLKIRRRSAENVVDEMEMLNKKYGVNLIAFNDNCFPSTKRQGMEVCAEIQRRGLNMLWKCDTRGDVIDLELAKMMKRAGCFMPAVGLESGSPKILENINKKLDLDKARESLLAIKEAGMIVYALLMVGNPSESMETIMETVDYLNDIRPHLISFVRGVMVLPSTEMDRLNGTPENFWSTGDDLPLYLKERTIEELDSYVLELQKIHKDPLPCFGGLQ